MRPPAPVWNWKSILEPVVPGLVWAGHSFLVNGLTHPVPSSALLSSSFLQSILQNKIKQGRSEVLWSAPRRVLVLLVICISVLKHQLWLWDRWAFCSQSGQLRLSGPRWIPRHYGKANNNNEEVNMAGSYSGICLITSYGPSDLIPYSADGALGGIWAVFFPCYCAKYQSGQRHPKVVPNGAQGVSRD